MRTISPADESNPIPAEIDALAVPTDVPSLLSLPFWDETKKVAILYYVN
jgi:hypothetical protein